MRVGYLFLALVGAVCTGSAADVRTNTDASLEFPVKALGVTFERIGIGPDKGRIRLTLENHTASDLQISAVVVVSIPVHNEPKILRLESPEIQPGESWTIERLAADDVIHLKLDGMLPVSFTIPWLILPKETESNSAKKEQ